MNVTPEQTKIAEGGTQNNSSAKIEERAGLYVGILGFGVAMLAIGVAWQSDKRHEAVARQQDQRINQLETQVLLAREDLRAIAPPNAPLRSFTEPPKR
jgi:hypothetical protein